MDHIPPAAGSSLPVGGGLVGTLFCFDTADNAVFNSGPAANGGVAFAASDGSDACTGLFDAPVIADASKLLDISFTHFDAGETFSGSST